MDSFKDIDYYDLDYRGLKQEIKQALTELQSAAGSADDQKAIGLKTEIAKLDQQIAGLESKKLSLQTQLNAIEKK